MSDPGPAALAQAVATFSTVHSFAGEDGISPEAPLVENSGGIFYGTTRMGGANGAGVLFQIDTTQAGSPLTPLYDFNTVGPGVANTFGAFPTAQLAIEPNGDLLLPVESGGSSNTGVVTNIHLVPNFSGTLHGNAEAFPSLDANKENTDGALPVAGLTLLDGAYFGVTSEGGAVGKGEVYKVTYPDLTFSRIYDLDGQTGSAPLANLSYGPKDTLFVVCSEGGNGGGSIFQIFNGLIQTFALFDGVGADGTNGTGAFPATGLAASLDGKEFGSAPVGGAFGNGVIYRVASDGKAPVVLHSFSKSDANGFNSDGAIPNGIIAGPDGNFYGTTPIGGANGTGTIFQITPAGVLTSLHSFGAVDANNVNTDGAHPAATLLFSGYNTFYGSTKSGGTGGQGTIFVFYLPPKIGGNLTPTAFLGVPFSYQIVSSNSPTDYSAAGLPPGLSVNEQTGLISGTPSRVGASIDVPLYVRNAFTSDAADLLITIVGAPNITSAALAVGAVGVAFQFTVTADNSPTTFVADTLPDGLTIDPATGIISGTPTAAGTFAVNLTATNPAGAGTQTLSLTIAPARPTVTLEATQPVASISGGTEADFTVTLSAAQTQTIFVKYAIKGSAENGVDYVMLSGQKKLKPGKTTKPIRIFPLGDLGGADKKAVKLVLEPDDTYTVGTTGKVKVSIEQ